ncbi:MAG: hypothetical protein H7Y59_20635 [Anaerolineales bacterium]|nr:hypothetical protein [Anaerolineales bacterium]
MYHQVVFDFDDDEKDPRYSVRPEVSGDAPEDNTIALIYPAIAEQQGIAIDCRGFPTLESMQAWHRKNNAHLFTE